MPEYLRPGVYVEETSFRGKPIQGVSTSTAGFVGAARKGPEGKPTFVGSLGAFVREFGAPVDDPQAPGDYLGHTVRAFFENGGSRCFVVRALSESAEAASGEAETGTVLRLAPGIAVRGPVNRLRLDALRGVTVGSVLSIHTRPDRSSAFSPLTSVTVASYDPRNNSVTLSAELSSGTVLEPDNTVVLVSGAAPGSTAAAGGGPRIDAVHRGADGNGIEVEFRPADRTAVALTLPRTTRAEPRLDLAVSGFPIASSATSLRFTAAALALLRAGDTIRIGGTSGIVISSVNDGELSYTVAGAPADFSGGAAPSIALLRRDGTVLPQPVTLGSALDVNLATTTTAPVPHAIAAMARPGDRLRLSRGGSTAEIDVTQARTAADIDPSADNVTVPPLPAGFTDTGVEARLSQPDQSDPGLARLFVADAAAFRVPAADVSPEPVAVTDGSAHAGTTVLLADTSQNLLIVAKGGSFPTADVTEATWTAAEPLRAADDGATTLTVASVNGFYGGAAVELDTGAAKMEATVVAVDPATRRVTIAPGVSGGPIELAANPAARAAFLRTAEMDVVVYENGKVAETFTGLTWSAQPGSDAALRLYTSRINDPETGSKLIRVTAPEGATTAFSDAPATADGRPRALAGGDNGAELTPGDLVGRDDGPGARTGIQALLDRDDISMVAVPGVTDEVTQAALIAHCERQKYRIAVLDARAGAGTVSALQAHRNNYDSKYAAYYAPWLRTLNPQTNRLAFFPPCGFAMGIYARTDTTVGVHKAPANETVRNVTEVAFPFGNPEQDVLNPAGVNLIRDLTPRGIRVWGARTISSDQEWKYVSTRRLFIFLEQSIDRGTQWVVFEPNSEVLWGRVVDTVSSFLNGVWRSGALMGASPDEAFFVTCDRSTMAQDDIDNGRLICEIGVAPVMPAEFVIFRIGQFTASAAG